MGIDHVTDPPPARAFDAYVINEDAELLVLRHAFSQRPLPGVWTTALHGHGADPVGSARDLAHTVLGLTLHEVSVVVASTSLRSPVCPVGDPEPGSILLGRTTRRVATPDPTRFDEADWVRWDPHRMDRSDVAALVPPAVLGALAAD